MLRSNLKKVVNKDRKLGAASEYYAVWVKDDKGTDIPLLFTQRELIQAMDRAKANPEDMPRTSIWDWINNLFNKVDINKIDDINN